MPRKRLGIHVLLEVTELPFALLNNLRRFKEIMQLAIKTSGATIVKLHAKKFKPHGISIDFILAESDASGHTWPELCIAEFGVFTCGHKADPDKGIDALLRALNAVSWEYMKIERGSGIRVVQHIKCVRGRKYNLLRKKNTHTIPN